MKARNVTKMSALGSALVLASALGIGHAGGAVAAEPVGDAQSQAQALLFRTSTGESGTASSGAHRTTASGARVDPQEQARTLILGNRSSPSGTAASGAAAALRSAGQISRLARHDDVRTEADAHGAARRMILSGGARPYQSRE